MELVAHSAHETIGTSIINYKEDTLEVKIEVIRNKEDGTPDEQFMPAKAHEFDAGFDIKAAINMDIPPLSTAVIPAGFKMQLPPYTEAQIRSRSGAAAKRHMVVANSPGTIDSGYTGEVCVIVYNNSPLLPLCINRYDRIAQMVITELPVVTLTAGAIDNNTERGANGFGSTGR